MNFMFSKLGTVYLLRACTFTIKTNSAHTSRVFICKKIPHLKKSSCMHIHSIKLCAEVAQKREIVSHGRIALSF